MKIKQTPEDFVVEEIINLKTADSGDYTYFWLTKKNWTTVRAIKAIAKKCRATFRRFKFAGTKDKFAVTKQAVSAYKIAPEVLRQVKIKDIQIEIIGKGSEQISLGDLIRNRFEIVVRDVKEPENIGLVKRYGFPNYFGPQRFGGGNTHLVGKEILKGNLEQAARLILTYSEDKNEKALEARAFADKNWGNWAEIVKKFPKFLSLEKSVLNWLIQNPNDFAGAMRVIPKPTRKMYINAYQGYLWNCALSEFLKSNCDVVAKKIGFQELTIPKSICKSPGELPIPGFGTRLGRDKFSKAMKEILKSEGIELEAFKCPRMPELSSEGTTRPAFVVPKQFKLEKLDETSMKLKFDLPKG
ncbi:MAG: tRNA pseudouridine(13) synthase TruD, partial [Candidatus Nanoarchaeia archaeon]